MPIKLTMFREHKPKPNYQLTEKGKMKAEEYRIGGSKGEVITALESTGPCTISELAGTTEMSPTKVRIIVDSLVKEHWVRKVSEE